MGFAWLDELDKKKTTSPRHNKARKNRADKREKRRRRKRARRPQRDTPPAQANGPCAKPCPALYLSASEPGDRSHVTGASSNKAQQTPRQPGCMTSRTFPHLRTNASASHSCMVRHGRAVCSVRHRIPCREHMYVNPYTDLKPIQTATAITTTKQKMQECPPFRATTLQQLIVHPLAEAGSLQPSPTQSKGWHMHNG